MKTDQTKQNIKLGIFVVAGIVLFLISVFFIGSENNVFNRTFQAFAIFKNVEGLKEGDNVWLSGVKIGTVKDVKIVSEGKVIVELSLKHKQNEFIKSNATAFIGSDGLVGNKIVVIRPGDARQAIHDADTINSASPTDTQELINIAKDVGENTRSLTDNLKILSQKVADGHGVVGELLNNGPMANELRAAVTNFRTTTEKTANASEQLQAMVYKLNNGDGLINRLATDTSLAYVFDETLANVKRVSQNSAEMSRNLEEVVAKLNSGNNAIGVLLADTAFANKMKVTLDNAKSASVKLDDNMEALQHNFLLRGYFRKKEKREKKAAEAEASASMK
jgi:phospholipid/cholesterol/gamma-HCH transport system substrate-binding protein